MLRVHVASLALLLCLLANADASAQSCSGNGLALAITGGRLGDTCTLSLAGPPFASGLFALDASPGPVSTYLGTICLGLTPYLQTWPFTLDGAGNFTLSGVLPPDPFLSDGTGFLQAAAPHPTLGGHVVSNGASLSFHPPRLVAAP